MAPFDTRSSGSNLCTTPACIHLASEILWGLAPNYTDIDPCTDFSQLACGSWADNHEIPAGENYIVAVQEAQYRTLNTVRKILEGSFPSGSEAGWIIVDLTDKQIEADKENFEKVQKAYDVCVDNVALEEQGLEPLAAAVKRVVQYFPAYNDNSEVHDYSTALGKTIALFESLGVETTQSMIQSQNPYNPEEILLTILPPTKLDSFSTDEQQEKFLDISATLLSAVHPANISISEATRRMNAVIKLEETMVEILNQATESSTGFSEINKLAPQLNYEYVVGQLAPEDFDVTTIQIPYGDFFTNLSQIISETPSNVIQTFFAWKAIAALSTYVESEETNAYNDFLTEVSGGDPESQRPRWENCVKLLDQGPNWIISSVGSEYIGPSGLTWILSHFFLDKSYSDEAHDLTSEIVDAIKAAFLERLEAKDWISGQVKKVAAEKVKKMRNQIAWGTDPDPRDPIALKEYYEDAVVTSSHVENVLGFAYVNIAKAWATLGKPLNRKRFTTSTLQANAFQSPPLNTMVLDAGIQQFPTYDVDFPSYLIYGGMGCVVGHELTHGFDNNGRLYDPSGNKTSWWDEKTIEAFTERTDCFVKQYNSFTVTAPNGTKIHVDGELTLGENIADAGGVATGFAAWKKWEKEKGPSKDLPGLDKFTHEQLFFLKWAQSWCQIMPAEQMVRLLTDEHPPNESRIKFPLANSREFREAFNCKKKEPTCELW